MKQKFIYKTGRTTALHHAQHIVVKQKYKNRFNLCPCYMLKTHHILKILIAYCDNITKFKYNTLHKQSVNLQLFCIRSIIYN